MDKSAHELLSEGFAQLEEQRKKDEPEQKALELKDDHKEKTAQDYFREHYSKQEK
jgi:hypothetical protein